MAANYTTEEINTILVKIDDVLLGYSNKLSNKFLFGINCLNLCPYYKLWLYKKVIKDWNQNQDGSDTNIYNSINREQFYNVLTETLNYLK